MALTPKEYDVAKALVDDLNGVTSWGLAFKAETNWLTEYGLEDLTTRRVIVSPPGEDGILGTDINSGRRGHGQFDFPIRLTYQARVDATDKAKVNAEARQVQDIHDRYFFDRFELTAVTGHNSKPAWVTDCQRVQVYDPDKLRDAGLFESILEVTVRLWRSS